MPLSSLVDHLVGVAGGRPLADVWPLAAGDRDAPPGVTVNVATLLSAEKLAVQLGTRLVRGIVAALTVDGLIGEVDGLPEVGCSVIARIGLSEPRGRAHVRPLRSWCHVVPLFAGAHRDAVEVQEGVDVIALAAVMPGDCLVARRDAPLELR